MPCPLSKVPENLLPDLIAHGDVDDVIVDFGRPEVLKAYSPELDADGRRNGFSVPEGARWFWLRFSTPSVDAQGESADPGTIRDNAQWTLEKAGWVDWMHWSRPAAFRKAFEGVKTELTPLDFVIGRLTDIRVSADGESYCEGYLWPQGQNRFADMAWLWLDRSPEIVKASAGGPIQGRIPVVRAGERFIQLKMKVNHVALCTQGINDDTIAKTAPFGEFLKAVTGGIPVRDDCEPCADGDVHCFRCFVREGAKGLTSEGAGGLHDMGAVPQDLEGQAHTELFRAAEACGHFDGDCRFRSHDDALAHLLQCLGWSEQQAHEALAEAQRPTQQTTEMAA